MTSNVLTKNQSSQCAFLFLIDSRFELFDKTRHRRLRETTARFDMHTKNHHKGVNLKIEYILLKRDGPEKNLPTRNLLLATTLWIFLLTADYS